MVPDKPLQPFAPPQFLSTQFHWSGIVPPADFVFALFALVFLFWGLYSLVAMYHWLKYSHASWIAFPAIALHLAVSFFLLSFALSGAVFL